MQKFLSRFLSNESGATAIEYGLIAATTAIVLVAAMAAIGPALAGVFAQVAAGLGG
jgi:pilus assembly protein Flp/PilA